MWERSAYNTLCKKWTHTRCSGNWSLVVDGFRGKRCNGETYGCGYVRAHVIWETLLMEVVERILLLQLESEIDG